MEEEVERNLETHPYDGHETRVSDYINEITKGVIGAGDDPVGFLIASHATLVEHIQAVPDRMAGAVSDTLDTVVRFLEEAYDGVENSEIFVDAVKALKKSMAIFSQPSAEPVEQKPE